MTKFRLLLFVSLILLAVSVVDAREKPWLKIENTHFVVLTDSKEKRALEILEELERFRVAAQQFIDVSIPEGAPPIRVVIFRSQSRFHKLVGSNFTEGKALRTADGPMIVMHSRRPYWRGSASSSHIARHEFVHMLEAHHPATYPCWYKEGFAELLATAEIADGYMLVGSYQKGRAVGLYSRKIKDEIFERCYRGEYGKYWLFTHYLTFNDNRYEALLEYLNLFDAGMPSIEAFQLAFGTTPSAMWKDEVRQYRKIPVYRIPIDLSEVDLPFQVSKADPSEIEEQLRFLEERFSN